MKAKGSGKGFFHPIEDWPEQWFDCAMCHKRTMAIDAYPRTYYEKIKDEKGVVTGREERKFCNKCVKEYPDMHKLMVSRYV